MIRPSTFCAALAACATCLFMLSSEKGYCPLGPEIIDTGQLSIPPNSLGITPGNDLNYSLSFPYDPNAPNLQAPNASDGVFAESNPVQLQIGDQSFSGTGYGIEVIRSATSDTIKLIADFGTFIGELVLNTAGAANPTPLNSDLLSDSSFPATINQGPSEFPAHSFFDVFVEIPLPALVAGSSLPNLPSTENPAINTSSSIRSLVDVPEPALYLLLGSTLVIGTFLILKRDYLYFWTR